MHFAEEKKSMICSFRRVGDGFEIKKITYSMLFILKIKSHLRNIYLHLEKNINLLLIVNRTKI